SCFTVENLICTHTKACRMRKDIVLARIAEINTQLDELQKKILSEAKLVATTLTKTFVAKQFPDKPFDVLILDEASMSPLPHLYWAISRCCEFVTIVGDFLQLPPICIAKETMAHKWLGRSILEVLGINSVKEALSDHRINLLKKQYRMAHEISTIPNRFFYENKLEDDLSTFNRRLDDGVSDSPLVLIETATMNPWCSRLSTGGRFNLYNALVCATLARKIIANIERIRKDCNNPNAKVGIITPYKDQARLINKIIMDWKLSDLIRVSTVHRFQGGEEPIIIFDSCEGPGVRVAPMLDDTKHDSDARLVLNVAITRTKNRFYFVGHTKHLLSDLHRDSVLARIIHYFYEEAEVLDSGTLVDKYFTTDFEKWADALISTTSATREPFSGDLHTEKNFWQTFYQDLKIVKERLIILSPFVTVQRSGRLIDYFRAMIERGIEIRIYTRPKKQQTGEMANQADIVIEQLRGIGARVIERRSMHQKVAILDKAIAWEGSLNILSHRDTGEQMRRLEGQSAIEDIIKNLELDEDMPVGNQTEEKCPGSELPPTCNGSGYLVVRINKKSKQIFLGCSTYPRCKYTKHITGSSRSHS
ncbi:MAG TPA: AAA domain-containing protein, partial [Candidatus Wunengus sp. YC65]|uniref:AAA domain-containing protein n=1 Tax=Candidatus Wunengus sp. YC65 TaxID=3367701 RepID=UPI0040277DE1